MVYLLVLSGALTIFLSLRLYLIKKEIKRAVRQLERSEDHQSARKLDLRFQDRDLENLAEKINEQIDSVIQAEAEKRRTENEWKQAIADMSHDIRTPLTSISGYIQLLRDDGLPNAKRQEYWETIQKSAVRLKKLLDEFFELSLAESPDYPLQLEPIRLNQLTAEVLMESFEQFGERGIEPQIDFPDEELIIIADFSAVKRVIENIIVNAIKYSEGSVSIRLYIVNSGVQLMICNSASELTGREVALLFNRFYKTDKTRSDRGAGLGLSIAKSHMERMGGNLRAELASGELRMICEWPAP